ncbi:hypothetical protein C2E23DRAFT_290845 [Lenzites betulinus]|nr:hypothetical protein C2E23DRAFT_290845 [Lenzites betulinus]
MTLHPVQVMCQYALGVSRLFPHIESYEQSEVQASRPRFSLSVCDVRIVDRYKPIPGTQGPPISQVRGLIGHSPSLYEILSPHGAPLEPFLQRNAMPFQAPLSNLQFSLDPSQLAGFLGADAALAAMMLPHLHAQRKWCGWYNCPGSYYLAKRYGQLARFRFWSPLYRPSAVPRELAAELGGAVGPSFTSASSGATLARTSPLASLLVEECSEIEAVEVKGRCSDTVEVVIVSLDQAPPEQLFPRVPHSYSKRLALFPIAVTVSTGIACCHYHDYYIATVIFLSALCHGIACRVMGDAQFTYQHRIPPQTPRYESGWLSTPRSFIVLSGTEAAIAPINWGRFSLAFNHSMEHCMVTACSILLGIQFLLQLLLVPQGGFFGQIMFLVSVVAAWFYHRLILARAKEVVERRILMADVLGGPRIQKYRFGTRTAAAVFTVLALRRVIGADIQARLQALLPSGSPVWELWHDRVTQKILHGLPLRFEDCDWEWQKMAGLQTAESLLIHQLFVDTECAYEAYVRYQENVDLPRPQQRN